jgi:hypothetical protein
MSGRKCEQIALKSHFSPDNHDVSALLSASFRTGIGAFFCVCPNMKGVSDTLLPKVGRKFGAGAEKALPLHRQNNKVTTEQRKNNH